MRTLQNCYPGDSLCWGKSKLIPHLCSTWKLTTAVEQHLRMYRSSHTLHQYRLNCLSNPQRRGGEWSTRDPYGRYGRCQCSEGPPPYRRQQASNASSIIDDRSRRQECLNSIFASKCLLTHKTSFGLPIMTAIDIGKLRASSSQWELRKSSFEEYHDSLIMNGHVTFMPWFFFGFFGGIFGFFFIFAGIETKESRYVFFFFFLAK